MKRTITLLIATALILGMSQCKKNVETITPSDLGEAVHITVNVDDGGKHIVYPGTGAYVFENGDKLYVGNGGHYIVYLTYSSGAFSGDIYSPSTEDYLHFYFVGGLTPSTAPVANSTENFTVNIADQSRNLPVISYAHSTQKYVDGTTTYGCTLLNKCGLVKFVPATATPETVKVGGMKTTAKIDFATPGITPTETTGEVTLYSESDAAKWAILLVQDEVSTPTVTIAGCNSTIASVPAVTENMYYTNNGDGVSIAMEPVLPYIDADFTVDYSGTTVKFSKGNLQYDKDTDKFSFMEHQYSTVETTDQDVSDDYANPNIVSLFGWGTSGWANGNYFYQPYNTSNLISSPYTYSIGYGYGPTDGSTYTYSLTGTYANADWGVYNKPSNHNKIEGGGDYAWRVLTSAEWVHVFNQRSTTSGHRYAKATVCGMAGVILLPDNWSDDKYSLNNYNTTVAAFTGNTIDPSGWATLEAEGCVFLPAAGSRNGTSVSNVGSSGYYWSSTYKDSFRAYYVLFFSDNVNPSNGNNRYNGNSVRLVF